MPSSRPPRGAAGDVTLGSYNAAADIYREHSTPPGPAVAAYLDQVAHLVGAGTVLELGSGPGWDASYLEARGLHVVRTDGATAFVEMLLAEGHPARLLDVRSDDLGGPYDAVLAGAVLLHLTRDEFVDVLRRAHQAVRTGGFLAATLKEGDGEAWTQAKLGLPRHFTYWRRAAVRAAVEATGWQVVSIDHVAGRLEPWLFLIARAASLPETPPRCGAEPTDSSALR